MTAADTWRRGSPRGLVVDGLRFLVSFAVLVAALVFWSARDERLAPVLLSAAVLGYLPLRIAWFVARWLSEKYMLGTEHLTVTTGIVRRKSRQLAWGSIVTVDESAGLLLRLFRLRQISLRQSDSLDGSVRFRALTPGAADEVLTRAQGAQGVRDGDAAELDAGGRPADSAVYRATWRELALMSLVNGRFALLAPPVVLAVWNSVERFGIETWLVALVARLPLWVVSVAAVVGFVLVGSLATISKYQGFSVSYQGSQQLVLTYGLLEKKGRTVDAASIAGIAVRRSLLEQILGRSRLVILTLRGLDESGGGVVLPSLPDRVVRGISRTHFGEFVVEDQRSGQRVLRVIARIGAAAAVFAGPVVLTVLLLEFGTGLVPAGVLGLLFLLVVTEVGRLLASRIQVGHASVLALRRALVTEYDTYVRAAAGHWIESSHVGLSARPVHLSFSYYAGGPKSFSTLRCNARTLGLMRESMGLVTASVAMQQRQRGSGSSTL